MRCIRFLLSITATTALAAADYTVDLQASKVAFAGTSTLHDFAGTAKLVSGVLHLDPSNPTGLIEADAASMATGSEGRDERMHSFVMDAPSFPRIAFNLTGWNPSAGGGTALGTWTMKGVTHDVSIPVSIAQGRATAHFTINIRDWGIKTPRMMFVTVGDIVTIDLDLALRQAP